MPCCLMLIKAPGSQRKETFANQCQVFHNAMVLLENIVLFHSSHRSTPHRDTRHSCQCHCGKTCPVKHASQWTRQFNTLCKAGGGEWPSIQPSSAPLCLLLSCQIDLSQLCEQVMGTKQTPPSLAHIILYNSVLGWTPDHAFLRQHMWRRMALGKLLSANILNLSFHSAFCFWAVFSKSKRQPYKEERSYWEPLPLHFIQIKRVCSVGPLQLAFPLQPPLGISPFWRRPN